MTRVPLSAESTGAWRPSFRRRGADQGASQGSQGRNARARRQGFPPSATEEGRIEGRAGVPEIEFGLDTFASVTVDESGQPLSGDVVIRNTVEEAVLADAVGIDSFNIGEHYRPEFMDSANHVMLAAIAGRTERIRLGTAVTVLSTQDPVRRVHRLRDPRRGVERPRAADRRPRLADRLLPAVRVRPRRLRGRSSRRSSTCSRACSATNPSPGPAPPARRSPTST